MEETNVPGAVSTEVLAVASGVVREGSGASVDREVRQAGGQLTWVPADACRLPTVDQPLRVAEFDDLFATAVQAVDRIGPARLRLTLAPEPEVAARAATLAVRETDCCGFFTFTLTAADQQLLLEVAVPAGRAVILDALAERAAAGVRS